MNPIFPSILSTNFFDLESKLTILAQAGIDFIHLDVMDGHFVDNISFGPASVKAIKSKFGFSIDAHLMVSNPGKMIPRFIGTGSDWVSFHLETTGDMRENIRVIRDLGRRPGLVLNPDTGVERVFPFLDEIDYVLLMSVFPGFGGQKFIAPTLDRVDQLKREINKQGSSCLIQVDGGLNLDNVAQLKKAGCDLFVIGTFLYNAENVAQTLDSLLNKINGA